MVTNLDASLFCTMPYDIMLTIIEFVKHDYKDLVNLKKTCLTMNRELTSFTIAKQMLATKIENYEELFKCVNADCYEDTYDIFTYLHNYGYRRYIHRWQEALNSTKIIVNGKIYSINSPYCCECLKTHILVGTLENVTHNYDHDSQVNIVYN
jgi:hypothetical protein